MTLSTCLTGLPCPHSASTQYQGSIYVANELFKDISINRHISITHLELCKEKQYELIHRGHDSYYDLHRPVKKVQINVIAVEVIHGSVDSVLSRPEPELCRPDFGLNKDITSSNNTLIL